MVLALMVAGYLAFLMMAKWCKYNIHRAASDRWLQFWMAGRLAAWMWVAMCGLVILLSDPLVALALAAGTTLAVKRPSERRAR